MKEQEDCGRAFRSPSLHRTLPPPHTLQWDLPAQFPALTEVLKHKLLLLPISPHFP